MQKGGEVYLHEGIIRGMNESTRPIIIFRNDDGSFAHGYVLRDEEFVTSLAQLGEGVERAGGSG